MSLHAVSSNLGSFGIHIKGEVSGIYVDWVSDCEALLRGDRIIECNGRSVNSKTDFQNSTDPSGRCLLVIIRRKKSQTNNQMQEDNQRLQHRISYLEDQVKTLLKNKDIVKPQNNSRTNQNTKGDHVTSISILSSTQDNDIPQVFQVSYCLYYVYYMFLFDSVCFTHLAG